MKNRISVGALIIYEQKILLVNHKKDEHYDFWVAPGGGVEGTETIEVSAIREVKEETGLDIKIRKLAYIEELYNSNIRICKFWFYATLLGGEIQTDQDSKIIENIVDVKFLSKNDFSDKLVFPPEIEDQLWIDLKNDFPAPKCLGLRKMDFY